ncbi:MAG: hypothetical protein IKG46_12495 [Solobacterium sp.]|nr:hypothetical protein [Solobacterium sp.]
MLKKTFAASAALALILTAGCSAQKSEEHSIVGGWTEAEDGTVTDEMLELFNKAMQSKLGMSYTPVKLLETQLVNGTNYKFLCEAAAVTPGAKTEQKIVTIYVDLKGNAEVLDIEDAPEMTGNTQIPNPFRGAETIEDAETGAGFSFIIPDMIDGYALERISYIPDTLIQVVYAHSEDDTVMIRKGTGTDDISGDYNVYTDIQEQTVSGNTLTIKGNDGAYSCVTWNDGTYTYSITADQPMSAEILTAIAGAMQ